MVDRLHVAVDRQLIVSSNYFVPPVQNSLVGRLNVILIFSASGRSTERSTVVSFFSKRACMCTYGRQGDRPPCFFLLFQWVSIQLFLSSFSPPQFSTSVKNSQIWAEHHELPTSPQQLVAHYGCLRTPCPSDQASCSSSKRAPKISTINWNQICSNEPNWLSHMDHTITIVMENNSFQLELSSPT